MERGYDDVGYWYRALSTLAKAMTNKDVFDLAVFLFLAAITVSIRGISKAIEYCMLGGDVAEDMPEI